MMLGCEGADLTHPSPRAGEGASGSERVRDGTGEVLSPRTAGSRRARHLAASILGARIFRLPEPRRLKRSAEYASGYSALRGMMPLITLL